MTRAWLVVGIGVLWVGCTDDENAEEGTGGRTTGGAATGGVATGGTTTGGTTTGGTTTGGRRTAGAAGAASGGDADAGVGGVGATDGIDVGGTGGAPDEGDCSSAADEGSCEARGCVPVIGRKIQFSANGGAAGQAALCELSPDDFFAGCALGSGGAINVCACKENTCAIAESALKFVEGWEENQQCTRCVD